MQTSKKYRYTTELVNEVSKGATPWSTHKNLFYVQASRK